MPAPALCAFHLVVASFVSCIAMCMQHYGLDNPRSGHASPARLSPVPNLRPPAPPKPAAPVKAQAVKIQRPTPVKAATVVIPEPSVDIAKHLASQ